MMGTRAVRDVSTHGHKFLHFNYVLEFVAFPMTLTIPTVIIMMMMLMARMITIEWVVLSFVNSGQLAK